MKKEQLRKLFNKQEISDYGEIEVNGKTVWHAALENTAKDQAPLFRSISNLSSLFEGYNGYIIISEKDLKDKYYNVENAERDVIVYGGITYSAKVDGWVIFGFDTSHCDSHEFPINDLSWIKEEVIDMGKQLIK